MAQGIYSAYSDGTCIAYRVGKEAVKLAVSEREKTHPDESVSIIEVD